MLKQTIKTDLDNAMRNHDDISKNTLRSVLSSFINELVAIGKTPRDELNNEEEIKVLKKMEKQRKDSLEKFKTGQREDLVEIEKKELEILQKYLPKKMEVEKIKKIAILKKKQLNIEEKTSLGILIGAVMKECAGEADGNDVKKIVEGLFY